MQAILVAALLLLGIGVTIRAATDLAYSLITGERASWEPLVLLFVLVGAIMLPAAGFRAEQLVGAYGIFGITLGYLVGKSVKE